MSRIGIPYLSRSIIGPRISTSDLGHWYHRKVNHTQAANLIGYWPMWDPNTTTIEDFSGNGRGGSQVNMGGRAVGIGDDHQCQFFNGTSSFINFYTASLAAAFSGAEGSLMIWAKVANAGVWSDSQYRYVVSLHSLTAFSAVNIYRYSDNILYLEYVAAGVYQNVAVPDSPLGWMDLVITWSHSRDRVGFYLNGVQIGPYLNGMGLYAGLLDPVGTCFGARNTGGALFWSGWLAHAAIWNSELTSTDVVKLARL